MNQIIRRNPDAEDVALINDIVGRQRLPGFIDDFELRLGLDSADEPAVWIVFHTRGDLPAEQARANQWIAEMNTLANALREQIIDAGAERFPFFRFEPVAVEDKPRA